MRENNNKGKDNDKALEILSWHFQPRAHVQRTHAVARGFGARKHAHTHTHTQKRQPKQPIKQHVELLGDK